MKGTLSSVKLLQREWDVVLGVLLGTVTAPRFTAFVRNLIQGVGGAYASAISSFLVALAALLVLGQFWPGLAVAFAAVYITQGAVEIVPGITGK